MTAEYPTELIDQLKPQEWGNFYERLLNQISENPNSNTLLVAGGLALSGKTAILTQLFINLENEERIKNLKGFNYVNFSFGTAMALGRKTGAIKTPIEQKGWETAKEYSEVSKLAANTLTLALHELPAPTLVTFDAVLLSGIRQNGNLIGVDRMAGAVYEVLEIAPAISFFITASEAQRRKADQMRKVLLKTSTPEERLRILAKYKIVDDTAGTPQMEALYFNTANPIVVKRTDNDVNDVMTHLALRGDLPQPNFDLKDSRQFSLPENEAERVRFMTEGYIPFWISTMKGRKSGETDFVFFNPEYEGLKHVYHSRITANKLTDALKINQSQKINLTELRIT